MTSTFSPLLAALIAGGLHLADYFLTLAGQVARERVGGDAFISYGGSYEANPVFEKAVDRVAWLSPRFVVTLLVNAGTFAALAWVSALDPALAWLLPVGLGSIVFTRVAVIARHLQNLWTFHLRGGGQVRGSLPWERPAIIGQSVGYYLGYAAFLGVVELIHPSDWFLGGLLGLGVLDLYLVLLVLRARKTSRSATAQPKSGDAAA